MQLPAHGQRSPHVDWASEDRRKVHLLKPFVCLCIAFLWVGLAQAEGDENSRHVEALVVQEDLPELVGRKAAAEAQNIDAAAFFAGDSALSRAFPDWVNAPLYQPGFVAEAQRSLLASAKARAQERVHPGPEGTSPEVARQWAEMADATLDAEANRDAGRVRLLAAISVGLEVAPGLRTSESAKIEATWATALEAGAGPDAQDAAHARAQAAGQAMMAMASYRSAAIQAMAIPGDLRLTHLVMADLARAKTAGAHPLAARARLDRIRRAAPLLNAATDILNEVQSLEDARKAAAPKERKEQEGAAVAAAQRAADQAKKSAQRAADGRDAALRAQVAQVRVQIAEQLGLEKDRHAVAQGQLKSLRAQLVLLEAATEEAIGPSPKNRTYRIHTALSSARQLIAEARAARQMLRAQREEAEGRWAAADLPSDSGAESLSYALADYRLAREAAKAKLSSDEQQCLSVLRAAKQLREPLYRRSSRDVQSMVDSNQELVRELDEVSDTLRDTLRHHVRQLKEIPETLIDVGSVGGVIFGTGKLVLVLGLWLLIRSRATDWTHKILAAVDPRSRGTRTAWEPSASSPSWMVGGDVMALGVPLATVVRIAADVCVAGLLFCYLKPRVPILGLLALIWLVVGAARLVPGLLNLAIITPAEVRPALRVSTPGVRDGFQWTARILVLWAGLDKSLIYVGWDVLEAPRMAEMAHQGAQVLLGLLALGALYRWAPEIRQQITSHSSGTSLHRWIVTEDRSPITGTLRAAAGAVVLLLTGLLHLLTLIIEGRAGLGWLTAALARRQIHTADESHRHALPAAQIQSLRTQAHEAIGTPPSVGRIETIFADWLDDPRRGMVALVGDRGMGKSRVVGALRSSLGSEHRVMEIAVTKRLADPVEVLTWLADQAGVVDLQLPETADLELRAEAVGAALMELPKTVFIVDDAHRLFLRAVGQFDGLRAALVAMQSSAAHHFWICGFHGPSYAFLDGVSGVSNLSVFRSCVRLDPMDPADLRAWLETAATPAETTPRYDMLLQRSAEGTNRDRMRFRAAQAYWRLMAEASQGNPSVALEYWLGALRLPENEEKGIVDVGMFAAPDPAGLDALQDAALFLLTALIVHDGATLEELHAILNLAEGEVHGTCRGLEAMGFIEDEDLDETYEVTNHWLPAVERLLRRKSFLHRR